MEIFNPTSESVDLSNYAYPSVSNVYMNIGILLMKAQQLLLEMFMLLLTSSDPIILEQADATDGDDGSCNYDILGDPGSGWKYSF